MKNEKSKLTTLFVVLLTTLAASLAQADVVLQDDFDGPAGAPVNAANWTATAPPIVQLDGAGNAEMTSGGMTALGGPTGAFAAQPTAVSHLRLSVTAFQRLTLDGNYCRAGLTTDGSGNTEILLRVSPSYGVWYLRMVENGQGQSYNTYVPKTTLTDLDWTIEWYPDRVRVFLGEPIAANLRVDTATAEPADILATEGTGLTASPAADMVPHIYDSGSGQVGAVTWESIDAVRVLIDDDFDGLAGDPVDPVVWGDPNGALVQLDGASHVVLNANLGTALLLALPAYGFQPYENVSARFTALDLGHIYTGPYGGYTAFGLTTDGGGNYEIALRVAHGGSWYLRVANGPDSACFWPGIAQDTVGNWQIDWQLERVVVIFNDTIVINTDEDLPMTDPAPTGAGFVSPTVNLVPYAYKSSENKLAVGKIRYESFMPFVPPADCAEVHEQGFALAADLNPDCYIDLQDFAVFVSDWLRCNDPTDTNCEITWP